jgi:hypothetical protein
VQNCLVRWLSKPRSSIIWDCVHLYLSQSTLCHISQLHNISPFSMASHALCTSKAVLVCGCIWNSSNVFWSALLWCQRSTVTASHAHCVNYCPRVCVRNWRRFGVTRVRTVRRGLVEECPYSSVCNTSRPISGNLTENWRSHGGDSGIWRHVV